MSLKTLINNDAKPEVGALPASLNSVWLAVKIVIVLVQLHVFLWNSSGSNLKTRVSYLLVELRENYPVSFLFRALRACLVAALWNLTSVDSNIPPQATKVHNFLKIQTKQTLNAHLFFVKRGLQEPNNDSRYVTNSSEVRWTKLRMEVGTQWYFFGQLTNYD